MSNSNIKKANISIFIPHAGCPHKCSFCDQSSITSSSCPKPDDVRITLSNAVKRLESSDTEAEIAFFGGSFTLIDRQYMINLLSVAKDFLGGTVKGIRISTRPDGIDDEILCILKEYGVTSIELGAQSMCDDVLLLNERGHTSKQVCDASVLIKKYGFELGLQMMTGLLGDSFEKSLYTANEIIKLKPDTVRIYPTVVLKNTKLVRLYKGGRYNPYNLEESVELCSEILPLFLKNGINVIKLGLHSSVDVEENYLAGCYHPAFRELVEGRLMLKKALNIIKSNCPDKSKMIVIYVRGKDISKMIGQKQCNVKYLNSLGYSVKIEKDDSLDYLQIRI